MRSIYRSFEFCHNCTEPEKDPLNEVVADHLERQGIKWDMGGVNAIVCGDSIDTSDGQKIRLSNIGSSIQRHKEI